MSTKICIAIWRQWVKWCFIRFFFQKHCYTCFCLKSNSAVIGGSDEAWTFICCQYITFTVWFVSDSGLPFVHCELENMIYRLQWNVNKHIYICKIYFIEEDVFDSVACHDDVIKWKHFPRYWPFVRGIHRSPVNSLHKGQWRGALMFSLICTWINGWVNNRKAGDLRRNRAHCNAKCRPFYSGFKLGKHHTTWAHGILQHHWKYAHYVILPYHSSARRILSWLQAFVCLPEWHYFFNC